MMEPLSTDFVVSRSFVPGNANYYVVGVQGGSQSTYLGGDPWAFTRMVLRRASSA